MHKKKEEKNRTYVFIDAANIIYGTLTHEGEDWKLDFEKLYEYLKIRYEAEKIFYFGGIDKNNSKQSRFYSKLQHIGYITILKKAKYYKQSDGHMVKKANCDVDLTFYAMKTIHEYTGIILMSGDGDFYILLHYLLQENRSIQVIANGRRTAKEIRQLVGPQFTDINRLKEKLEYTKRGRTFR
jgi:uncharacterized LabA/DUF88 family protein